MKHLKKALTIVLVQVTLTLAFGSGAFPQGLMAPSATQIDQSVTSSLNNLYAQNDAARTLGAKAKAVLVFPEIKKAAFIAESSMGTERCAKIQRRWAIIALERSRTVFKPA